MTFCGQLCEQVRLLEKQLFLPLGELAYLKSLPKLFPDLDGSIKFYPDLDVLILDFLGARYPGVAPGLDFLARAAGA